MVRSFVLAVSVSVLALASVSAEARGPVSVTVGQTQVMSVSYGVTAVQVDDGSVLEAKRRPDGAIALRGKTFGKTRLTLKTVDGDPYELMVHVVSPGARVYVLR
jgi:Flp pilus assembly secretin CpaC